MGSTAGALSAAGSLAAGGASIASAIQGKNAAEQAAALQRQALNQTGALGNQSTLLGLAQLDLQRQMSDRMIDFSNQWLGQTQPFRAQILGNGPLQMSGTAAGTSNYVPATGREDGWYTDTSTGQDFVLRELLAKGIDPRTAASAGTNFGGPVTLPGRTFTPTPFTQTPAERDTLEAQFRNAREATISNSPVRGGQLGSQLLDLEMGRAGQIVGLESALARRNQEMTNAAALTNFQAQLDADRFNAADAINVRNANFQSALADRNMAAQIGFGASGVALPAMQGASAAYNPSAAGAIFGPALNAQSSMANAFGQQQQMGNQMAGGGGAALGSLAAAGKLAQSKGQGNNTRPGGSK